MIFIGTVNIVGDLLFAAVFWWNAAGAALVAGMAQVVGMIFSIIIIKKRKLPLCHEKRERKGSLKKNGTDAACDTYEYVHGI